MNFLFMLMLSQNFIDAITQLRCKCNFYFSGLIQLIFFLLDMLTVEEQQNKIRYSIQLDHCYTSRLSPNDPIPRDPLPIADDSPDSDVQYVRQASSPRTVVASINDVNKGKNIVKSAPVIIVT